MIISKTPATSTTSGAATKAAGGGDRATVGAQIKELASTSTSDQVTLTPAARRLLEAGQDASAPINQARVDALRAAVSEGSYQIDARRIAERLLAVERQL